MLFVFIWIALSRQLNDYAQLEFVDDQKNTLKIFIHHKNMPNFEPLKPHFYIVKLGFTGEYIIFLISAQNIDCGYSLEPPRRGGSNEYLQFMFWAEIWKSLEFFIWKLSFFFLVVKFWVYLNRFVFVMFASWPGATTNLVKAITVSTLNVPFIL